MVVPSDKCYENREWNHGYRESDPLGGHDPYSASKGCQEVAVAAYRRSFFAGDGSAAPAVRLASARAGNVIGGGDWAIDRVVTDCVTATQNGEQVRLRRPDAVRPWQHVLEPLSAYLWLAARLLGDDGARFAKAWNFGPASSEAMPVRALVERLLAQLGEGSWVDARNAADPHEAGVLLLSCDQAHRELNWFPTYSFEQAVEATASWYREWLDGESRADMYPRCVADIARYCEAAARKRFEWASG